MTRLIKNRLFCTALLLSSIQLGVAQTQTSIPTFSFGPPLTPVWDITSIYQITNHMQGNTLRPTDVFFRDIIVSADAHGKLQGSGTTVISVGDDFVGGDYKVSGNITGGGVKTRVNFSIKFKGNGNVSGVETTCNINAKYNLAIDPAGLAMVGTTSGNASFSHLGSGNLKGPFSQPLPHGADGRWIVMLDVAPLQKIAGTGTIFVDNYLGTNTAGRILSTKLSGSVSKRPLMAKTKMSGSGDSGGTQLNMNFTSNVIATNQIASIKGKILGQKVQN